MLWCALSAVVSVLLHWFQKLFSITFPVRMSIALAASELPEWTFELYSSDEIFFCSAAIEIMPCSKCWAALIWWVNVHGGVCLWGVGAGGPGESTGSLERRAALSPPAPRRTARMPRQRWESEGITSLPVYYLFKNWQTWHFPQHLTHREISHSRICTVSLCCLVSLPDFYKREHSTVC